MGLTANISLNPSTQPFQLPLPRQQIPSPSVLQTEGVLTDHSASISCCIRNRQLLIRIAIIALGALSFGVVVGLGAFLLGSGLAVAFTVGAIVSLVAALGFYCCSQKRNRSTDQIGDPNSLIGVQKTRDLLRNQLRLDDKAGTYGVNFKGTSETDQKIIQERISNVLATVGPYAHTHNSYKEYVERIDYMTIVALGLSHKALKLSSIDRIVNSHRTHQMKLREKTGKPLKVSIMGAGPIGLAAAIAFYQLGFDVCCYEKRERHEAFTRNQPFSLTRQNYWFLEYLGISKKTLLDAFGSVTTKEEIARDANEQSVLFSKVIGPIMRQAKINCIGYRASEYIPQSLSFPIKEIQSLLMGVFEQVNKQDAEGLSINFNAECISSELDVSGRMQLKVIQNEAQEILSPDIVYNATGGKINDILGFERQEIGTYYGMGAFFDPPEAPNVINTTPFPELSRAVRVFCSFKSCRDKIEQDRKASSLLNRPVQELQPVYCGVELTQEEYENKQKQEQVLGVVSRDVGLHPAAKDSFTVKIQLQHVKRAARVIQALEQENFSQTVFAGGDSLLQPHFLTASGANFGLFGLIELNRLFDQWIKDKITYEQVVDQFNVFADLLQKQSAQTVLNLFARPLVRA